MSSLIQDVRYALRQLRKSPGFALTVVITLALGIGANTAIFTLVHGILLRTLPVGDPAQLYRIGDNNDCCVDGGFPGGASETGDFSIFSYDLYKYLRVNTPEFEQLAAVQSWVGQQWAVRRGNTVPKGLHGEFVSGNYFTTLGIGALVQGRVFTDMDDTPSVCCASGSAELRCVAGRLRSRSSDRGVHDLHSGEAVYGCGHRSARLLWRSSYRCAARFLDTTRDGTVRRRRQCHPSSPGLSLALPDWQSSWRDEYWCVADQDNGDAAPMALSQLFIHRQWRRDANS